jgi:hypothetical protein
MYSLVNGSNVKHSQILSARLGFDGPIHPKPGNQALGSDH